MTPPRATGAPPTKIGLVGYGPGGRKFHAPFIADAAGVELAAVVTRSPQRALEVWDRYGVPVYGSQQEMLEREPDLDAVAISTPAQTRAELVIDALDAGRHVVADKPLAPSAAAGQELVRRADDAGLLLGVYYNRRWDADVAALAEILRQQRLGTLWRVHNRFDVDEADTLDPGPDGGLLRDLGIHLVDQMVWLLGSVSSVDAHLDVVARAEGPTDAGFVVTLHHGSGAASFLSGSKTNGLQHRSLTAYGSRGSFSCEVDITDVVALGRRSPPSSSEQLTPTPAGVLVVDGESTAYPLDHGGYHHFYEQFGAAVRGEGELPVAPAQAVESLAVLDAALVSGRERRRVELVGPPGG